MSPNSQLPQRVLGGAAIAVALYTILFSGIPNFSTSDAEKMLSELSAHLAEQATHRGKEARLQYSNVEIRGWGYDKWAYIAKPSLDFIYQQWQGGKRVGLSTEGVGLLPDQSSRDRLVFKLAQPLNIISGSDLLAVIQPTRPFQYSVNRQPRDLPGAIRHKLYIPGDMIITMIEPRQEIALHLKNRAYAEAVFVEPQHRLRGQLTTGEASMNIGPDQWATENADLRYESLQKSSDTIDAKGTLTIDKLTFSRAGAKTSPYTVTAAWTTKYQRNINGATDSAQFTLEHSLLTDGDRKVSANGFVNFDIDDAPYGEIVVEITNPADFIKGSIISADKQALALALLNQVMGEDMKDHKQAIIPIERKKNGTWMVGKITLESLLDQGLFNIFIFTQDIHDQENRPSEAS